MSLRKTTTDFFPVIPIRSFNGGIGLKVRMKAVKAVYLGW